MLAFPVHPVPIGVSAFWLLTAGQPICLALPNLCVAELQNMSPVLRKGKWSSRRGLWAGGDKASLWAWGRAGVGLPVAAMQPDQAQEPSAFS